MVDSKQVCPWNLTEVWYSRDEVKKFEWSHV